MPKFKKGEVNNPDGRPVGSKNKMTKVKDAVFNVFHDLGGEEFLKEWALKNPTEFMKIASKLIPKDIHMEGEFTTTFLDVLIDASKEYELAEKDNKLLESKPDRVHH